MASYLLVRELAWAGSDGTFSEPPLPHSLDPPSLWKEIKKLVWDYLIYIYGVFLQKISIYAHVHSINAGSTIRAAHLDMFMFSLCLYIGSCI